jgi:hypothetical protein
MVAATLKTEESSSGGHIAPTLFNRLTQSGLQNRAHRHPVAYRAWLMDKRLTQRGYVMDVSETGAKLLGMGFRFSVGSRVLLKFQLNSREPTLVVRCQIIRFHSCVGNGLPDLAIQFLDLKHKDQERLRHFLYRRPASPDLYGIRGT